MTFKSIARLSSFIVAFATAQAMAGDGVPLFTAVSDAMPDPGTGTVAEHLVALDAATLRTADTIEINVPG